MDPWGSGMIDNKPGRKSILTYTGQEGDEGICFVIRVADSKGNVYQDIAPIVIENYNYSNSRARSRRKTFENKGNFVEGDTVSIYIDRHPCGSRESRQYQNTGIIVE